MPQDMVCGPLPSAQLSILSSQHASLTGGFASPRLTHVSPWCQRPGRGNRKMGTLLSSPPGIKYSINLHLNMGWGFISTTKHTMQQPIQETGAFKQKYFPKARPPPALASEKEPLQGALSSDPLGDSRCECWLGGRTPGFPPLYPDSDP